MTFSPEHHSLDLHWIELDRFYPERFRFILNDVERKRADAFYFERDRRRWSIARGVLKTVLGNRLQCDPARIEFEEEGNGKPKLAGDSNRLSFNLSHSGERMLLGIADGLPIGVDTELIKPLNDHIGIAERFFAGAEYDVLVNSLSTEQLGLFYRIWTKKEAYIKATGEGLSCDLKRFVVPLEATDGAVVCDPPDEMNWHIYELPVESGYVASFCFPGFPEEVRLFRSLSDSPERIL